MLDNLKNFNLPEIEEKILKFWQEHKIFEKSLASKLTKLKPKSFVFYEGPPTANGRPGLHHVLARSFKDIICRYKTMAGFLVERKAGWDTHGLPVELEVEKELGLKNKNEIEKYGIAEFNAKCRQSVWKYKDEWEKLTDRMGFWLDMKNPYITYENNYIETLWWIIKQVWEKKLLVQDYKVSPHCPRCVTTLSSHELAQGYKNIKEQSIYVKFKIRNPRFEEARLAQNFWAAKSETNSKSKNPISYKLEAKSYFLVWTTTPWTLPANVALAVNPKAVYVLVKIKDGENLILAKERIGVLGEGYEIIHEYKGKDLAGWQYEPLFDSYKFKENIPETDGGAGDKEFFKNNFKVVAENFVTLADGSGIVHIAPAFGEDDMNARHANNLGILNTVDLNGLIKAGKFNGLFVKKADPIITKDLEGRRLLFKTELYEHDYPFCWRCDSPLLYYAKSSWFIKMSQLRGELIANNKKINWIPAHIKEGRFGEWLREVKDWAISRERYWGTPLPVWQCQTGADKRRLDADKRGQKGCGRQEAMGSRQEILSRTKGANILYFVRHGQALSNEKNICNGDISRNHFGLVKKGVLQVNALAKKLTKEKFDLIFVSDFLRTKETAEILAAKLKHKGKIIFDKRLRDIGVGKFEGAAVPKALAFRANAEDHFNVQFPAGESHAMVAKRMASFLKDIGKKYSGKKILVVSHQDPMKTAYLYFGMAHQNNLDVLMDKIDVATLHKFYQNEKADLSDLHRPYVDKIALDCECGGKMKRVKEVMDVWFDSGAMPFAQAHYPFEDADSRGLATRINADISVNQRTHQRGSALLYPADYICEAIDQTRGWFYTLLAISTLLGRGTSYKNVICLGLILDKYGQKMSKSRGNVVDPWEMFEKYGADVVRWHFYTVNPPGEPKRFDEKDLGEVSRRFFGILYNSFIFYHTYADKKFIPRKSALSPRLSATNVLDRWILARLNETILKATKNLEKYEAGEAAREIEKLVDDLSRWYIRRSRRRFQRPENKKDFEQASAVLGFVLLEISKLVAPFAPFFGEALYKSLTNNLQLTTNNLRSVHLENWPVAIAQIQNSKFKIQNLIKDMEAVRRIASLALAKRAEAQIKIRQPIASLKIKNQKSKIKNNKELLKILADEINVKKIVFDAKIKDEIELDIKITPELREEGILREFVRMTQGLRQKAGYKPHDKIQLFIESAPELGRVLNKHLPELKKEVGAKSVELKRVPKFDAEEETRFDGKNIWIGIKKI